MSWHRVGCDCPECVKSRAQFASIGKAMKKIDSDPVERAKFDARIKAAIEKGRKNLEAYRLSQRGGGCQCCCCRRY